MINYEGLPMEELIEKIKELVAQIEEQKNKIEELSVVDHLTSLFNRKALYTVLEYEISRMDRIPTYLSVSLILINDLEKISERHGEKIKDVVIVQVADNIKRTVRASDIIGRYDDDVFMIISPDINPNKGTIISERIQDSIKREDFPLGIRVTTSAGVKHYEGEPANKLISIAEGYLRLSRKEGKNKIVSSL